MSWEEHNTAPVIIFYQHDEKTFLMIMTSTSGNMFMQRVSAKCSLATDLICFCRPILPLWMVILACLSVQHSSRLKYLSKCWTDYHEISSHVPLRMNCNKYAFSSNTIIRSTFQFVQYFGVWYSYQPQPHSVLVLISKCYPLCQYN